MGNSGKETKVDIRKELVRWIVEMHDIFYFSFFLSMVTVAPQAGISKDNMESLMRPDTKISLTFK